MPGRQVNVDGVRVTNLIDVEYDKTSGGSIGTATVTVANTDTNRSLFESGAEVEVVDPNTGVKTWTGEVNQKPSNTQNRNLTLEITAESKMGALEYANVDRPFIELTNAEVLRESVAKEADPEVREDFINESVDSDLWVSNGDEIQESSTDRRLGKNGPYILYVQINEGRTDTVFAERDFDPSIIPGRRLKRLESRFIVNNTGGTFDVKLSVTDADGIKYEFEPDEAGLSKLQERKFEVEEATITTGNEPGKLRFEVTAKDETPENRAFGIDFNKAFTFRLVDRNIGVTTDIEDTDFATTRVLSKSIAEMVDDFSVEDGYVGYVTSDKVLKYKQVNTRAPFDIDTSTNDVLVTDITIDRDFDVRNRVTIDGAEGVKASFEDTASIQFYNEEAPKSEPIENPNIRTQEQARKRARGYLNDNAWEDSAITLTVVDPRTKEVEVGDLMGITIPSEDVDGDFVIDSIMLNTDGTRTLSVTGTTSL
jgi:hypothetical protein